MQINITKLSKDNVITLGEKCQPQALELEMPGVEFAGMLEVNLTAEKKNDTVIIKGELFLPLILTCSRCLLKYPQDLRRKIVFDYTVERNDTVIDLTEDLRSEIILDYSSNFLCKPDCKGLCPKCGEDLNKGKCSCN